MAPLRSQPERPRTLLAIAWIDWYAYHIARLRALAEHPLLEERVVGIELVGGAGVHGKLVFRDEERHNLPLTTLLPHASWVEAGQFRLACEIWQKLNQLQPAVLLVPGYYTIPAFAMALWARLHRRRSILMTESTRDDHRRNRLQEYLKGRMLTALFDGAITGGLRQAAYAQELGFDPTDIAHLYDVVDNNFYESEAHAWREKGRQQEEDLPEHYFVYVGRLAPEKNLGVLLRSYRRYRANGGRLSLVLIGDGPERSHLERAIADLNVQEWVHITGLKNAREIARYYAFADWFVLPSIREPWGLVVNEAMSAGLPLLLSDRCGCFDDLLSEGKNGFGFDGSSEDALTAVLMKTAVTTEEQRLRMAAASKVLIAKYSPAQWAEEVVRIGNLHAHPTLSIA